MYYSMLALLILLAFPQVEAGWQGIVPLHSTRADVKRRLGAAANEWKTVYKVKDATVIVEYAPQPCKGALPGWRVPTDTVLRLTVVPKKRQRFQSPGQDSGEYRMRRDDTLTTYYTSDKSGIEYEVSAEGFLTSVSYIPSDSDSHLRCAGFPANDEKHARYYPLDSYVGTDLDNEKFHLDQLAMKLQEEQGVKAYLIAYAGKFTCAEEVEPLLSRAKNYLVREREIDTRRVETVFGGHRDKPSIEVYVVPQGAPAPLSMPTEEPGATNCGKMAFACRGAQPKLKR